QLLILDEPTNHLDMDVTLWLEKYLAQSNMALLMVTHDRYFLDRVCSRILELSDRRIYSYDGNYAYYVEKREERAEALAAERESDLNRYRRELDWMRRQPQARATKAQYRIDSFHELEEKLRQKRSQKALNIDIKSGYIGKKIFEIRGLNKRFDDKVLMRDFSYTFQRYDKIGIVGNNGTGKSTFIKMLLGEIAPDGGTIDVGSTVRFGYYSQQGIAFDDNTKVIDVVSAIAEHIDLGDGRRLSASQMLQMFLFEPPVQHNFVSRLSGGERRRLYLCTVLMRNPNFLILDEPTNDLDIATLQVLEEYLQNFSGCVMVVSHDRYFMDKVADHLLVFEGEGQIKDFPGTYSDFLEWRTLRDAELRKAEQQAAAKATPTPKRTTTPRADKLSYKEKREMESIEQELPQLEAKRAEMEAELSSGTLPTDRLLALSTELGALIDHIDEISMRWLELSEKS
ncbi:MAG: ABC-F family ATP-binding cassette domain-containing protein, partial [Rikenellaceae bacterium]|nr:ABC-F family ATP-binding cassette domain-containing protein [Rikenellaceae bacterium]